MASEAMGSLRGRDLKNSENLIGLREIQFGLGFRSLGLVITKLQPFYSAHFNLKHTVSGILKFGPITGKLRVWLFPRPPIFDPSRAGPPEFLSGPGQNPGRVMPGNICTDS